MARAVDSEPALAPVRGPEQVQVPALVSAQEREPELAPETETVWPRVRSAKVLRFHNSIRRATPSRGLPLIGKFVERWTRE